MLTRCLYTMPPPFLPPPPFPCCTVSSFCCPAVLSSAGTRGIRLAASRARTCPAPPRLRTSPTPSFCLCPSATLTMTARPCHDHVRRRPLPHCRDGAREAHRRLSARRTPCPASPRHGLVSHQTVASQQFQQSQDPGRFKTSRSWPF